MKIVDDNYLRLKVVTWNRHGLRKFCCNVVVIFFFLAAVDEQNGLNIEQGPANTQSPSKAAIQPSSLAIPEICIPEMNTEPIPSTSDSGRCYDKDVST